MKNASRYTTPARAPSITASNPEAEKRLPFDANRAKQLLAEAGYPNGFEVTLDCPNNRYVNDEEICIAVAAMLTKVGIEASCRARSKQRREDIEPNLLESLRIVGNAYNRRSERPRRIHR